MSKTPVVQIHPKMHWKLDFRDVEVGPSIARDELVWVGDYNDQVLLTTREGVSLIGVLEEIDFTNEGEWSDGYDLSSKANTWVMKKDGELFIVSYSEYSDSGIFSAYLDSYKAETEDLEDYCIKPVRTLRFPSSIRNKKNINLDPFADDFDPFAD